MTFALGHAETLHLYRLDLGRLVAPSPISSGVLVAAKVRMGFALSPTELRHP